MRTPRLPAHWRDFALTRASIEMSCVLWSVTLSGGIFTGGKVFVGTTNLYNNSFRPAANSEPQTACTTSVTHIPSTSLALFVSTSGSTRWVSAKQTIAPEEPTLLLSYSLRSSRHRGHLTTRLNFVFIRHAILIASFSGLSQNVFRS